MRKQRISVYTGPGSSNSWVWLADFFEKYGFFNIRFCSSPNDFLRSSRRAILIMPGGDTFAIANSFGEDGLRAMGKSIAEGAIYIGICAGAYLPLRTTIPPLSAFNLVDLKIKNISSSLPEGLKDAERYSLPYGCGYIFHPVRGPVRLKGEQELVAPLYGGPMMISARGAAKSRLKFEGLTEASEILIERELCERTVVGAAACIESPYGDGKLLLISPHLEHPEYAAANDYFAHLISECDCIERFEPATDGCNTEAALELRRAIADLRVSASGMENMSWKIGIKYWESEKLLFFIDAARRRLDELRKANTDFHPPADSLRSFMAALAKLRTAVGEPAELQEVIDNLSEGASKFLNAYFSHKMSISR
ncbi:MAG: BPL-N domain-containing protein [Thermoplasmata archaeon]